MGRLLVGLLLVVLSGCASSYGAVTLANNIELHNEYNLVGDEVPAFEGNTLLLHFPKLLKLAESKGLEVYRIPLLGYQLGIWEPGDTELIWGIYDYDNKAILLEASLSVDATVATFIHELGHVLQPDELKEEEAQIFAEAVAFLVCKELGLDLRAVSFPYFNRFEQTPRTLLRYAQEIDVAVEEILGALR